MRTLPRDRLPASLRRASEGSKGLEQPRAAPGFSGLRPASRNILVDGLRPAPYLGAMYFKQILNEDCGCSSYVVASRASRDCVVVDAALDIQPYLDVIQDRGLTLRYIVDTHLHADHVSGSRRLSGETGVPVSLHESADVLFPFEKLQRQAEARARSGGPGGHAHARSPPGVHLAGHHEPAAEPAAVDGPDRRLPLRGRRRPPDFGGPDAAGQQYESSRRLLGLEDYVEVFPAHFEGSCGRGMCGRPSSTIGFERRFNPMLLLPTKEAFVRELDLLAAAPTAEHGRDHRHQPWRRADELVDAAPSAPARPGRGDRAGAPEDREGRVVAAGRARGRGVAARPHPRRAPHSAVGAGRRGCPRFPAGSVPLVVCHSGDALAPRGPVPEAGRLPGASTAWLVAPPAGRRRVCRW